MKTRAQLVLELKKLIQSRVRCAITTITEFNIIADYGDDSCLVEYVEDDKHGSFTRHVAFIKKDRSIKWDMVAE